MKALREAGQHDCARHDPCCSPPRTRVVMFLSSRQMGSFIVFVNANDTVEGSVENPREWRTIFLVEVWSKTSTFLLCSSMKCFLYHCFYYTCRHFQVTSQTGINCLPSSRILSVSEYESSGAAAAYVCWQSVTLDARELQFWCR